MTVAADEGRSAGGRAGERTALLLIDVQNAFDQEEYWGGGRNNRCAEANIGSLLNTWRAARAPVVHVRHASTSPHSPLRVGHPGHDFKPEAGPRPDERVFVKRTNSAFIGTSLEAELRAAGVTDLVIAGFITNHCVSTTARMAANLGFLTVVVSDATATFDCIGPDGRRWDAETVHAVSLASLHGEFATIATTVELCGRAEP
jgi:nicotinamidase-related amidase